MNIMSRYLIVPKALHPHPIYVYKYVYSIYVYKYVYSIYVYKYVYSI